MAIAEELYPQEGSIAGAAPGGIPEVEERIARRIAFFEEHAPIEVEVPAAMGPAGRETYGWIDFGHLPNTRDLGGLAAAEGSRVKPKLLLRSGALGFGSCLGLCDGCLLGGLALGERGCAGFHLRGPIIIRGHAHAGD